LVNAVINLFTILSNFFGMVFQTYIQNVVMEMYNEKNTEKRRRKVIQKNAVLVRSVRANQSSTLVWEKENNTKAIETISARENQVLQLLAKGLLYKEIADQLHISTATVRQHIHKIYEKLHVQNRTEAINKAFGKT